MGRLRLVNIRRLHLDCPCNACINNPVALARRVQVSSIYTRYKLDVIWYIVGAYWKTEHLGWEKEKEGKE